MHEDIQQRLERLEEWQRRNPLRVWREKQGLSMRQAAPIINTNFNSIQDWEQGQYEPNSDSMEKITRVTDITRDQWELWWADRPAT